MLDLRRYVLIPFADLTQDIIDNCIQTDTQEALRHCRFKGDTTDYVMLKWRDDKPIGLWDQFPVYTEQEMNIILEADLNSLEAPIPGE